jgi:hypothetical protein
MSAAGFSNGPPGPSFLRLLFSRRNGVASTSRFAVAIFALLRDLIGSRKQRLRYGEAERLRSFEVDRQFEARWLRDRHIARFLAIEDTAAKLDRPHIKEKGPDQRPGPVTNNPCHALLERFVNLKRVRAGGLQCPRDSFPY